MRGGNVGLGTRQSKMNNFLPKAKKPPTKAQSTEAQSTEAQSTEKKVPLLGKFIGFYSKSLKNLGKLGKLRIVKQPVFATTRHVNNKRIPVQISRNNGRGTTLKRFFNKVPNKTVSINATRPNVASIKYLPPATKNTTFSFNLKSIPEKHIQQNPHTAQQQNSFENLFTYKPNNNQQGSLPTWTGSRNLTQTSRTNRKNRKTRKNRK
jgi:hypothetical protein